ncbi:MAG: tRNA lysidine(34) synthetase TilS [Bradyrhizobium sp.]|nr:MAG: tRNA lysidine(34) synthetase TilS [Bradyrhizobium sp.]
MRRKPPLDEAEIDALLAPLQGLRAVLIAVSGGPDSTALLAMAAKWAQRAKAPPNIAAATVDHGLRAESAGEAEAVGALCRQLGVPHRILVWNGPKPQARLQELAREARYRLLAQCAREIGAEAIVTAHHLDDQAETALFRLLRGSGVGGLKAMAENSDLGGLALLRPLLGVGKRDLVAYCEANGLDYARDASNHDPRFARTRLRPLVDRLAEEGLDAASLARLARRARQVEDALIRQTEAGEARLHLTTEGNCDAQTLFQEPIEIVQRLLTAAIARVGGKDASRIGLEKIEAMTQALARAVAEGAPFSRNVAGARVRLARGVLKVEIEPPRRAS